MKPTIRFPLAIGMLALATMAAAAEEHFKPLALHPANPHYFLFRGKPAVLMTSGEHYGAVLNRGFDYRPYLDELHQRGFNLTRTFSGVYFENRDSFGIVDNTLAPSLKDYAGPWMRTDRPGAGDGGNLFDLEKWNAAYFERLHDFVAQAGERGIIVEFDLFCTFYDEKLWSASPMKAANNVNGIGTVGHREVYALKEARLTDAQDAFVRKVVSDLQEFDNVYFEICNEPYFEGVTGEWQEHIGQTIADAEKTLSNRHLIAWNIANKSARIDRSDPRVSLFNFHYAITDAVDLNYAFNRALGDDETGFAGTGDRAYRQEAWGFLLAGGATFSNLDYSYSCKHPDGTDIVTKSPGGGGPEMRKQLAVLKQFIDGFDFVKMMPDANVLRKQQYVNDKGIPPTARILAEPGKQYAVYVRGGTGAELTLDLPMGNYHARWISPRTGAVDREERFNHAGGERTLPAPPYAEDIALQLKRISNERQAEKPSPN